MKAYVKPLQPTVLLDFDDCMPDYNSSLGEGHWKADTKLFIMQHSHIDNFSARMDNRRTWMHFAKVESISYRVAIKALEIFFQGVALGHGRFLGRPR